MDEITINDVKDLINIINKKTDKIILIGGQAIAVWADRYNVLLPDILNPHISRGLDFLAGVDEANYVSDVLHGDIHFPNFDDVTTQSAIVFVNAFNGKKISIDFLYQIIGVDKNEITNKAIPIEQFYVMHPMHCMESRIHNLKLLPTKRNEKGIAQAHLSIDVLNAHISHLLKLNKERSAFKLIERIGYITADDVGKHVYFQYGIDTIKAVPANNITNKVFHEKRWPQILDHVTKRRESYGKLLGKKE